MRIIEKLTTIYKGRWPNGMEVVVTEHDVTDPIPADEAPVRGVTEPCLICDHGMMAVHEHTEKPWVSVVVGARPCPNCRAR